MANRESLWGDMVRFGRAGFFARGCALRTRDECGEMMWRGDSDCALAIVWNDFGREFRAGEWSAEHFAVGPLEIAGKMSGYFEFGLVTRNGISLSTSYFFEVKHFLLLGTKC